MDARDQTAIEEFTNRLAVRVFRGLRWRDCGDYRSEGLGSAFSRLLIVERTPSGGGGTLVQCGTCRRVALRPGCAYLIPAGLRFDLHYRRGLEAYSLYLRIDDPFGNDLLASVDGIAMRRLSASDVRTIASLAGRRQTLGEALLVRSALIAAFAPLVHLDLAAVARGGVLADRFADILAELHRLPPAQATVGMIARRVHQTPGGLAKRFRRATGLALKAFLLDRLRGRMLEAVSRSSDTIAEVAARLGYHDQFYFSRAFKRLCGMSPSMFRASLPGPQLARHRR